MARMHRGHGGFGVILGSFAAVAALLGVVDGVPPSTTSPAVAADRAGPGPTVVITGANRGLGLEFARQFHAAGARVIGTARRPEVALASQLDGPAHRPDQRLRARGDRRRYSLQRAH